MATVTSLGFNIWSTFRDRGIKEAQRGLIGLDDQVRRLNSSFLIARGRTSTLSTAMLAAAPAAKTMGGVVAGSAAVAAAGLSSAAVAGVAYGKVLSATIKHTMEMRDEGKALSGTQQAFVKNVDNMTSAWDKFIHAHENQTLAVANQGVAGLTAGIRRLNPIIDATHPIILRTATAWRQWMEGPGAERFVNTIVKHGVPALDRFEKAARNVLSGLGFGFREAVKRSTEFADSILATSERFKNWAVGGGWERFFAWVDANRPVVQAFFDALGAAIKNVSSAMGELGPRMLMALTKILEFIAALDPVAIQIFFGALLGLRVLAIVASWVGMVTSAVRGLIAVFAFISGPVGLVILAIAALVAAFIWLWNNCEGFRNFWIDAWEKIKLGAKIVWDWLVQTWKTMWPVIKETAAKVWDWLVKAWHSVWNGVKAVAGPVWNFLVSAWNTVCAFLKDAYDGFIQPVVDAFRNVWPEIATVFNEFVNVVKIGWDGFTMATRAAWDIIQPFIKIAVDYIVGIIKAGWDFLLAIAKTFGEAFMSIWRPLWELVSNLAVNAWNFLKAAWQVFVNFVEAVLLVFLAVFTGNWEKAWTAIKDFLVSIWELIKAFVKMTWDLIVDLIRVGLGVLKAMWELVWGTIKAFFELIWNGMLAFIRFMWDTISGVFRVALDALNALWQGVWNGIRAFFISTWESLISFLRGAWDTITGIFTAARDWIMNGFWAPLGRFFTETIPNAVSSAVDGMGRAWDRIKELFRAPVKWVIDVVWNGGIVKAWNWINDLWSGSDIGTFAFAEGGGVTGGGGGMQAFANGGPVRGPGTGTSDSITAKLSNNEHVWTAREVRAAGGHAAVAMMRSAVLGGEAVRAIGDGSYYAEGGGLFRAAVGAFSPSLNTFLTVMDVMPKTGKGGVGAGLVGSGAGGIIDKSVDSVVAWVKDKLTPKITSGGAAGWSGPVGAGVQAALDWARTQNGLPYQWGGNGNPSWDCSGFLSAIESVIRGERPHRRWSTHAFQGSTAPPGWVQNLSSPFMIGITDAGVGHTAGTLAGVNVECRGGDGCVVGPRALNHASPMFKWRYGLAGYHMGTPGAHRGPALVGENGMELVNFRGGERVWNNDDLRASLVGRDSGSTSLTVNIDARGATPEAVDKLKNEVVPKLREYLAKGTGKRQ